MRKLFIYCFILFAASILLSSCRLFVGASVSTLDNRIVQQTEALPGDNPLTVKEAVNSEPVKGYNQIQPGIQDSKEASVEINNISTGQETIIGNKIIEQNSASKINYSSDSKGINKSAISNSTEHMFKSNIVQPANYSGGSGRSSNGVPFWLIVICTIIIPPLGVALMFGITDKFWICLALTFCFWLPGMIYGLIQVLR